MFIKSTLKNITLFAVLVMCLWVGWSDFEFVRPDLTQDEIRESIRFYIRHGIQYAIQYLIPLIILAYFGRTLLNRIVKT